MTYNKPELTNLANAINAVRAGIQKTETFRDASVPHPLNATPNAYEADE